MANNKDRDKPQRARRNHVPGSVSLREPGEAHNVVRKQFTPLESQEAEVLARWLTLRNIIFTHVPNEIRAKHPGFLLKRKRQGVQTGFPDYLIFTRGTGLMDTCPGVALELKRQDGQRPRPEQLQWLDRLDSLGWVTIVAYGASDAIEKLKQWGY